MVSQLQVPFYFTTKYASMSSALLWKRIYHWRMTIHEYKGMWLGGGKEEQWWPIYIHFLLQQIRTKCLLVMCRHIAGAGAIPEQNKGLALWEDRECIKVMICRGGVRRIWGLIKEKQNCERQEHITSSTGWHLVGVAWEGRFLTAQDSLVICSEGANIWKERKTKEAPGREGWKGLLCLNDIIQQHGGKSLGQRALKSSSGLEPSNNRALFYQWTITVGWGFKGCTEQANSKWLEICVAGLLFK